MRPAALLTATGTRDDDQLHAPLTKLAYALTHSRNIEPI
jgi:hypothetical protein